MSTRKRSRAASPQASEAAVLSQVWAETTDTGGAPLPGVWSLLNSLTDERGHTGLVRDLVLLRLLFQGDPGAVFGEAIRRLREHGLDGPDWRAKAKAIADALPQPYEFVVELEMDARIAQGASERQAARQTAAKLGGSASFDAAVQHVRTLYRTRRRR